MSGDTLPTATRVADPGLRALYRQENRWQAWLDVEAALARAQAQLGIIPAEAGEAIAARSKLELMDRQRIDEGFARTGHTLVPLVWELSRVVGEQAQRRHLLCHGSSGGRSRGGRTLEQRDATGLGTGAVWRPGAAPRPLRAELVHAFRSEWPAMSALAYVRRKAHALRYYSNVRGVIFFAQRRVLRANSRRRLSGMLARLLPPANPESTSLSSAVAMEREGFAYFDGVVTPGMVREMRRYLAAQPVFTPYVPDAPRISIDSNELPDSHILSVPEELLVCCPHLLDVANHPVILATVEGVFGCKPTVGSMSSWWSIPTRDGVPRHAENFHRDVDDVHFLKLFIYLDEVGPSSGPHEYVRGSAGIDKLNAIKRYSDQEVFAAFGRERLVTFTGPAGTVFLENTFGLHRGQPVRAGRRLILQIVYSMLPMAYGPAKPYSAALFAPTERPIDPYTNRIYVAST
jgi:hypothetical protein